MLRYAKTAAFVFQEFATWRATAGWDAAMTRLSLRLGRRFSFEMPPMKALRTRSIRYPVVARFGGSSDFEVFEQIFVEREYASLLDLRQPRHIMDLGGNAGYSSVFFLNAFPEARVFAVEPDPRNFAVLQKNLAPYGERAQCIHAAAWSENGTLELSQGTFGDGREWATEVKPLADGTGEKSVTVPSYDMPTLMEKAKFPHVDLLKVDIEGSEVALFGGFSRAWMPRVGNLCVELHGPDCEAALNGALQGFHCQKSRAGELTICRDIRAAV